MMRKNNVLRKYIASLLLFLLFETVAITLWKAKGNLFYLLNFSYIGGCLALGTALFTAGKRYARHFVQLTVGSYMLLYLGVISCENMQIEGFWYYLFLGVFEAATIHYAVAKIFGPLFFNHCDESKCVHCGKCLRICPMNVEVNKESRKRKRGTE